MKIAKATKGAVERVVRKAFGNELHHLQVLSLSMIVMGIIKSDRLGVSAVGRAMAQAYRKQAKHGIKQVDRFLSNEKLSLEDELFALWVPLVVGPRNRVLVAMDWTDFDNDDHTTLSLSLITREGRTVPLVWLSVYKSELKGRRNAAERRAVQLLRLAVPDAVDVVIVADRGFDDTKLYRYLTEKLGFDFIIRFRENIYVHYKDEELWPAKELVPRNGRIRVLVDTVVTANCSGPWNVVLYKARGMKDPWCLVTSAEPGNGRWVVSAYGRRFRCEETFRDLKDRRFGYGLRFSRIGDCMRRDRFLFVFSLAYLVLFLLGRTSETLGLDRQLRANTVDRRTHSLFQQGRWLVNEERSEVETTVVPCFRRALTNTMRRGVPHGYA